MTKSIAILIFLSLFGLNAYIYLNTEKKIQMYAKSPPFRMEDFTKSSRKNKLSKIHHLTDGDKNTFWIKEENSSKSNYDLELEVTLTHVYSESKFKKKEFESITFFPCNPKDNNAILNNPNNMHIDVVLREAINVDKELRLPTDTLITSFHLSFVDSTPQKFSLKNLLPLQDSTTYPNNIFILTLFMKDSSIHPNSGKSCLAEVVVN